MTRAGQRWGGARWKIVLEMESPPIGISNYRSRRQARAGTIDNARKLRTVCAAFMAPGFKDYLREAFNARPFGMFVAPNWIGLGAFGLLGLVNPGFWLIGAGAELGYLLSLTGSTRFRRWVQARAAGGSRQDWNEKLAERMAALPPGEAQRFSKLEQRCRGVLEHQRKLSPETDVQVQSEGLGRLLWIYLGLLQARQTLQQGIAQAADDPAQKLKRLEAQLPRAEDENVRKSLTGQIEILRQRAATHQEGRAKLDFLDAELARIEEQVELIREQSLLAADPAGVSRRIDEVGATLGGTTQWMRDQQKIYGELQDLTEDAPSLPLQQ